MAVTTPEVIKANLTLVGPRLLRTPEELESFKRAIGTDVQLAGVGMGVNVQTGVPESGVTLILNRERIALDLTPGRSIINRDYPLREDLPKLANVAGQAINCTSIGEQQLRAFGFNIDLIFDQDPETPAFTYISRRLFDVDALGSQGWQFIGGSGKLIFSDGERRWTITLEPRFNDETESRIFSSVNLHRAERTIPTEDEIRSSLQRMWDEVHNFVERLDERGSE